MVDLSNFHDSCFAVDDRDCQKGIIRHPRILQWEERVTTHYDS